MVVHMIYMCSYLWKNYLYCVGPGESGGFFSFFLAGRRSPLTRAPILCEPEVSLVGKFRFLYIYDITIFIKIF